MVRNTIYWRPNRRSASVPVEIVRIDRGSSGHDIEGARKANLIANMAAEDTDAIAAASRRHDRDFLHDISAKLANINTVRASPSPVYREPSPNLRSRPPPPPVSPSSYSRRSPATGLGRASRLSSDDNDAIDAFLQWSPSTGLGRHSARSASLPPPSTRSYVHAVPARPTVPRWFPWSSTTPGSYYPGYRYGSRSASVGPRSVVPVGLPPPLPRPERLDEMTDMVVGVARTSAYGDIVIGIPYKKRYMYNAQRDYDELDTQSLPPMHLGVPTRVSSAPVFAPSRSRMSLAIPNAGGDHLMKPFSRASYAGPGTIVETGTRPYYPTKRHSVLYHDYDDIDDGVSTKSYPVTAGRRPAVLNHHTNDIENDIATSIFGDAYNDRLASLSKDYKTVLNRYSNGPRHVASSLPDAELDRKYGQILASLQPRSSAPYYSTTSSVPWFTTTVYTSYPVSYRQWRH